MNPICEDIFRAIHERKWLKIEYRNKSEDVTNYWIGIIGIDVIKGMLSVRGMHLGTYGLADFNIFVSSIMSSVIIDGTYWPTDEKLLKDIAYNPEKYKSLFDNVANLKILNYLEMCSKLDTIKYYTDFELIKYLDRDSFDGKKYLLCKQQFAEIIKSFSISSQKRKEQSTNIRVKQLAMNALSVHSSKGIYLLAYKKLNLDVEKMIMRPDDEYTICTEFQIDGTSKESVRKYLDADDYELLDDFENNQEQIKDAITKHCGSSANVDDMPYVVAIGMDIMVDLHKEYAAIVDMYENGEVSFPIKAFFGDLLDKPRRTKSYPIALVNNRINLDQLLAINKAMQYPTAYIQGPPGTGKTNTIINTIITAYFNDRTVLFASNNNHPIDSVYDKLRDLTYKGKTIPFPVLRLGNQEKLSEAIGYINALIDSVSEISVFDSTLDKRKDDRSTRAKQLTEMLKTYEDYLDLEERRETLKKLLDYNSRGNTSMALLPFNLDLEGRQLHLIEEKIESMPQIKEEDALKLLDRNEEEFLQYLFYTSAKHIQRLKEEKYSDLINILRDPDRNNAVGSLSKYLSKSENIKKLTRVFPIIITTCISSHRLGEPQTLFDMTIIDEASQCNTAMALLPIIRGENLMLVGDPQQLNPVIVLDEFTNRRLRKEYNVSDEYDYISNSIYKVFLSSDSVSDEILLHNHYRCDPRIIGFNNRKYYNNKLDIKTEQGKNTPLVFVDVENDSTEIKNTSIREIERILSYVKLNKDKNVGIITPFANQRDQINKALKEEGVEDVVCGTVHSFQGDEKDIILFSTAIGDNTYQGTYDWIKNNHELINVATSRPKDKLIVLADMKNIERLHNESSGEDDLYELINYVKEEGKYVVTPKETNSRALGVKPFSTETESSFLENLNHALENIWLTQSKYTIHKEVAISQVFQNNNSYDGLFYTGRFDFVVYEKNGKREVPVLAIELDGKEHMEDEAVKRRDAQKNKICEEHNLQLIRVENTYARRYNYVKDILFSYFKIQH